jgi:hypothetical protein
MRNATENKTRTPHRKLNGWNTRTHEQNRGWTHILAGISCSCMSRTCVALSFVFCVVFLFILLSPFLLAIALSVLRLRLLITHLMVSSNFSYRQKYQNLSYIFCYFRQMTRKFKTIIWKQVFINLTAVIYNQQIALNVVFLVWYHIWQDLKNKVIDNISHLHLSLSQRVAVSPVAVVTSLPPFSLFSSVTRMSSIETIEPHNVIKIVENMWC